MNYPPLLNFDSESEYRNYFESTYCKGPVMTFDNIKVRFKKGHFNHCCYESSKKNNVKDQFSQARAERLHWIKLALEDANSERHIGWDKKNKNYTRGKRVTIVMQNFIVVIGVKNSSEAFFVTSFVADSARNSFQDSTLDLIKKGPKWLD